MRLSIITINHNNAPGLQKTIESVINQSYKDYEYIIIDGGSTDESVAIIKTYEKFLNYWVSEKDSGVYNAQNKGLNYAQGDYVLFLNSGDFFYDDTALISFANNNSDEDIIYGDIVFKSEQGEVIQHYPDWLSFDFFIKDTLPHPCTLIRKSLFSKYGIYDEHFKICADWVFFMDVICKHNATYRHVNKIISVFLLGGLSSKPESFQIVQKEKQDHLKSSYSFFYEEYERNKKEFDNYRDYQKRLFSLQQSRFLKLISRLFPASIKKVIYE